MGKKKDPRHSLEQESRGELQSRFSKWVLNSLEEDYAFDFEVRPVENSWVNYPNGYEDYEVIPEPFYVQLKASQSFPDEESAYWDLEVEFLLDDCLQAAVPVVLFIYEQRHGEFYWCVLQRYCWDVLDQEQEGWRNQSIVRVTVEREPLVGVLEMNKLRYELNEVTRRISTRQHIASVQRLGQNNPPNTSFASTDQVEHYSQALVDEARSLIAADQIDRALEKSLQIYQLPRDDESTLDAIRFLLELRTTDELGVAFTKLRFIQKGVQLAEEYGREDLCDLFYKQYETAWEFLETNFVGARYDDPNPMHELLILDLEDWTPFAESTAGPIAIVQYQPGGLGDELAPNLVTTDRFELVEPAQFHDPRAEACSEYEHDFDIDDLQTAPSLARCSKCDLYYDVISQWLKHEAPQICDGCQSPSYDLEFQESDLLCTGCR